MSETPELLGCPFECGKPMNFEGIPQRGVWPDASFRVLCMCGARGPKGDTPAEAVAAWNTRARPAPTSSETPEWVLVPAEATAEMLDAASTADVPWEFVDTATGKVVVGPFALELSGSNKISRATEVVAVLYRAMIAARAAMPEGMREAVARIIDPEAFDEITADDNEDGAAIFAEAWEEAVAKASAILRLIAGGEG